MSKLLRRSLGLLLVLCMVLAQILVPSPIHVHADAAESSVTYSASARSTVESSLAEYVQDGCTLHCWNWSLANIKANLGLIASQGYSAIQISPMQEQKESSVNKPFENWWVVYQPISFNINENPGNAIGTREELIDLCEEAHKYDIKVIMDVVSNHLANNGTANTISSLIPADIRDDASCWHDYTQNSWDYSDRYNITQYCMAGLPDLNTGSDKIQNYVLNMLKDYIDCGVDGFRFDAAKQIETPSDRSDFASDFWPTVVNGANEYAASTRGIYLYNYGELLENPDNGGQLSNSAYTPYISLTESVWSNDVRYRLEDKNASGLQQAYFKDVSADKLVLWAESHDTFGDGSSVNSDPYVLFQAWALVTSRAYTMSLYFPRANDMLYQEMGQIAKAGWSSDAVKAVNKFHNHFIGQGEYLTKDNTANMYYNERGNSGVMIVNFSGGGRDINIPVYAMANGTYYDQLTGNKFTVSGGRLYGTMGDTGVACVYNPSSVSCSHASHGLDGYCYDCYAYVGHSSGTKCSVCGTASTRTIYFKNSDGWSNVYLYGWHDNNTTITSSWPGNKMTLVDGTTDIYSIDVPVAATNIIFNNNGTTQTANLVPSADNNTYDYASGFWSNYGVVDAADYYLFGSINGADYNSYGYKFVDGQLTTTFDSTSYVFICDSNGVEYMTNDWVGEVTSATLYNVTTLTAPNKLMIPGGVEVTLTVVPNTDGTVTLSYTTNSCVHSWGTGAVTTAATCESAGVRTYTCSGCGQTKTETIAALGHNYVSGTCANCGQAEPVTDRVIYFKNTSGWSAPYIYAWNDSATITNSWPGNAMTKVSGTTDIYSYTLSVDATKVIFTNKGSSQTSDLTIPTDGKNMYTLSGNSWSVYGEDSGDTTVDYYLFGYINGADYGCEDDHANLGEYKFVDGKLTATFDVDSYVAIKTGDNANWYMAKAYVSTTSGTFYNTSTGAAEKMLIPGGVEVTMTLTVNSDGTLGLSYVTATCVHSYTATTTEASCTAPGKTVFTCQLCGDSYTQTIPQTGHMYGGWYVKTAATCTTDGEEVRGCSTCGLTESQSIPATGHSYTDGKCTVCGNADPNCSHSYSSKVTTAATCLGTGLMTYTCSKCGDVYTEEIPANGHDYTITVVAPTCENNGYTIHACNNCSYSYNDTAVNPIGHDYSTVVTAPTCTEKGYTTYTCANCGNVYTWNETAALGHSYAGGTCTTCGEADPDYVAEYYLFGYINGADYGIGDDLANLGEYKFVNGSLTVKFTEESYVAVKSGDNAAFYMTNGYVGSATSATLYKFTDPNSVSANKLLVPGGQTVTFTLTENWDGNLTLSYTVDYSDCVHISHNTDGICATCGATVEHTYSLGVCTVCGAQDPDYVAYNYYLFGSINGANYGCEEDASNLGDYIFVDGKLTVTFNADSYVGIKEVNPGAKYGAEVVAWYMTDGWQGEATSVTLYDSTTLATADKLFVPSGCVVTFTMVKNDDGSITLSYTTSECAHAYGDGVVTTEATCTTAGVKTYTCTSCGHSYTESIAALGHSYTDGACTVCGGADPDYSVPTTDYYLFGWINGANYACEEDWENLGQYKFVDGKLTATFESDSYIAVKDGTNTNWYMTQTFIPAGTTTATFINTNEGTVEKMFVPGDVELSFTLVENADGTLTVSYTIAGNECNHSYTSSVTTEPNCTTPGVKTFTCLACGDSYTESIAATGHSFSNGSCLVCGAADPDYVPVDPDYYLFGYINGADYGCGDDLANLGAYKFVDGKLTVKFTEESYVAVKTGDNASFYMTNGYVGSATSATLYRFADPNSVSANKLMVPGNQTVTFTLTENWDGNLILSYTVDTSDCVHTSHNADGICSTCGAAVEHSYSLGVCTVCGVQDPDYVAYKYYLFGYINGANYGCEEDASNLGDYIFTDGKLVVSFESESYVGIKEVNPGAKYGAEVVAWYMTDDWQGTVTSVTLYDSTTLAVADKLYIPGGVTVTFTMTKNDDGTVTLSYSTSECAHNYELVTHDATCKTYADYEYICSSCGASYILHAEELASSWIDYVPAGLDASAFNSKTQYRHRNITSSTNTIYYVDSWPSGFDTSNALYNQYNNKSNKVAASDSVTIVSDEIVGYLYYHWCYEGYPYTQATGDSTFNRFHAYYSTKTPDEADKNDPSDDSYRFDDSTACTDSVWYFAIPVYGQTYTEQSVGEWSEWSDTTVTASSTCEVESRTVYQLASAELGNHSYVDGACSVCGAVEPSTVVTPSMTITGTSLSFEDEIFYNIYYTVDNPSSIVEMGLVTFTEKLADGTHANAVDVIPGYVSGGGEYMVHTNGIPAKNMGDAVYFRIYAKLTDGSYVYGNVAGYHAVAYAKSILAKSTNDYMKALVVAMVNYGAEAQLYFGYNTDSLMNSFLTADQQALISAYDESMIASVVSASSAKTGSFPKTTGAFSGLSTSVSFDGAFSINYYFTPGYEVDDEMTMYWWDAATYNSAETLTKENASGSMTMTLAGSEYWGVVEGIAAKEIDQTVYVAGVYTSGGVEYTTGVTAYSLGHYCKTTAAKDTSTMQAFAQATAVYGYYAKAYFANN
ncbi:MAG: starch-binding protein [Oscillospiraceae bacterium]|nr:starch-binding protein [Oscillospiraceae bacterium]